MSKVMYEKEQVEKALALLDKVKTEGLQSIRNMALVEMTLRDFKLVQEHEDAGNAVKEADDGSNEQHC